MSDKEWGVDAFVWVDGDPAVGRWAYNTNTVTLQPAIQVQGIPDAFENYVGSAAFSQAGAWYVTQSEAPEPGIVYYAPYSTGVFQEVARLSPPDDSRLAYAPHPDGLIVVQPDSRWVAAVSLQQGVLSEQILPAPPTGGDGWMYLIDMYYQPRDSGPGFVGLVFEVYSGEVPGGYRAVCFTTLAAPGDDLGFLPDILMVETFTNELETVGTAVGATIHGVDSLYTYSGISNPGHKGEWYSMSLPDAEVNPGLSLDKYQVQGAYFGAAIWEPTGAPAQLYGVQLTAEDPLDPPGAFPIPSGVGVQLHLRTEPMLVDITSAELKIGDRVYELRHFTSTLLGTSNSFYSDDIWEKESPFVAGQTYDVEFTIRTSSSGARTTPIRLEAGGTWRVGFDAGDGIGSVSTTNVFQEGGVIRHLVRMVCDSINKSWGGTLVWAPISSIPPFWTMFRSAVEVIDVDGGGVGPNPDPDPDPEPGDQYADFELGAGTVSGEGLEVVGFAAGQAGTLQPENPVIGGINGIVYTIAYSVGDELLMVEVDDIFGASGATLTVAGVGDFVLDVEYSQYGFSGSLSTPVSPFVDGETYSVRLYLDGELASNDPNVVFDATVTIGDIGNSLRGFDARGEVGDLDPPSFTVGDALVEVDLLAFAPSEMLYPESPGRTLVATELYCGDVDPADVGLESASLAFNGLIVELDRVELSGLGLGLAGLLPESSGSWLPDFDDQIHVTLTLQGFEIPDPAPEEPYEPVGDPIAVVIDAVGEDHVVGFSYNVRGSVGPTTIEYEGRTFTIVTADMYNWGEGDVEFFFELNGDATGLAFAGSGFDIGGVLVGVEAGNYGTSVQFGAWHEDLQPWQDGETYSITFYPGQEG